MYRTDFVKFEFRLHWEMRKSDSSYGDHESLRSKIGIICFFLVYLSDHVIMIFLQL